MMHNWVTHIEVIPSRQHTLMLVYDVERNGMQLPPVDHIEKQVVSFYGIVPIFSRSREVHWVMAPAKMPKIKAKLS